MPESNIGLAAQVWEIIRYPFAMLVALITWLTGRQIRRVDSIEKNYVSTETLNRSVESLRGDIKGIHSRLDSFIDRR